MNKDFFSSVRCNLFLAVTAGVIVSYVDLHSDDVQPAVLLILVSSFILGCKAFIGGYSGVLANTVLKKSVSSHL